MDQPTEVHHLQDLGSTAGIDPAMDEPQGGARTVPGDPPSADAVPGADPAVETIAGRLGFEGSADNPTQDDHFTGGSR